MIESEAGGGGMYTKWIPMNIRQSLLLAAATLCSASLFTFHAGAVETKNCPNQIDVSVGAFEGQAGYINIEDKDSSTLSKLVSFLDSNPNLTFTERLSLKSKGRGRCVYGTSTSNSLIDSNMKVEVYTEKGSDTFRLDVWVLNFKDESLSDRIGLSVYAGIAHYSPQDGVELRETSYYSLFAYFRGKPSEYYDGGFERRRIGIAHRLQVH